MSSLGSLVVSLSANTAQFQSDMGRAAHVAAERMERIKKSAAAAGAAVGAAFAAGAGIAAVLAKQALDNADAMGKMAQSAGLTAEAMSGLAYAAKMSGIETGSLTQSLSRLAASTASAAAGAENDAARALSRLGIAAKDASGQLKTGDQVLKEVAARFSQMGDGAGKTALAVQLFGESGAKLIPMLNAGAHGLEQMADEAERLGLVISTETAKAAEQFNDNLARIGSLSQGVANEIMKGSLPALNEWSRAVVQAAKDSDLLTAAWVGLGGVAANIFGVAEWQKQRDRINELTASIATARKQLGAGSLKPDGATDSFFSFLIPDVSLTEKAKDGLRKHLAEMERELATLKKAQEEAFKPGFDTELETSLKFISTLRRQAETMGMTRTEMLRYEASHHKLTDAQRAVAEAEIKKIEAFEASAKAAEANRREAERLQREDAQGWIAYIDAVTDEYERGLLDFAKFAEEAERRNEQLRMESEAAWVTMIDQQIDGERQKAEQLIAIAEATAARQKAAQSEMTEFTIQAARNMQTGMAQGFFDIMEGRSVRLGDVFAQTIKRMVAEMMAANLLKGLFGDYGKTGNIGGLVGSILSGARANGGPVMGQNAYLVGERGPEIFVPNSSGSIVPNHAMGAGSGGNVINMSHSIHIDSRSDRAQVMAEVRREVRNGNAELVEKLQRARMLTA